MDELRSELKAGLDDLAREAAGQASPVGAAATLRRARQRRRRRTQGAALLTVAVAGALVLAGQRLGDLGGGTTEVPVAPATSVQAPPAPPSTVPAPVTTTTDPEPDPATPPEPGPGATDATRAGDEGAAGAGSGPEAAAPGPGAAASGRRAGRTWRLVVLTGPGSAPPGGVVPPGPVQPGVVAPPLPPSAPEPGGSVCLNLEWPGPVLVGYGCRSAGDQGLTAAEATGEVPARALVGWAPPGATTVRVELRGRSPLRAAAVASRAWVAFPPEGVVVIGVAAYDRNGRPLARTGSVGSVPGPPGVVPSPLP